MNHSIKTLGRVSAASVKKHTGNNWDQWVSILNESGASKWIHKDIAAFLKKKYKLTAWWQHIVAGGYEIHLGRRVEGQNIKGEYSMTATKVMPLNSKKMWTYLVSSRGLALWLKPLGPFKLKNKAIFETEDGAYGEVRTMLAGRRIRLRWSESDGESHSYLQVHLVPRTEEKCIVVFTHEKLKTGRLRNELRLRWKQALENLADSLEP
ncbi:MAG TPA: hypothetical protein VF412_07390 [Bdellovibrio sp.]|uniref:hypothetical protein n=1 Tax=Bdellovibrio sp. TaxID=28201 RepID=UPI002EE60BEA